jgi:large subunit ribosomal protein L32
MAVPKRKHSNSRTNKRRAHDFLTPKAVKVCAKCSTKHPPHVICPNCGYYMSRVVVAAADDQVS